MKEIWKDIKGYEGYYQVSNLGRVRSLDRTVKRKNGSVRFFKGKILKPHLNKYGYCIVILQKNNKKKTVTVHRLVATAFIPNPENKPEVNHIDGRKTKNCVTNLEWCSSSENRLHAYKTGLKKAVKNTAGQSLQMNRLSKYAKNMYTIAENTVLVL